MIFFITIFLFPGHVYFVASRMRLSQRRDWIFITGRRVLYSNGAIIVNRCDYIISGASRQNETPMSEIIIVE